MDHEAIHKSHKDVLKGDPRAPSRLVNSILEPLIAFVSKAAPSILDRHDIEDCCHDALLDYFRAPHLFDEGKSRLFSWIAGKARYRALTKLRDNTRRSRRQKIIQERVRDEAAAADKSDEEFALDVIRVHDFLERHAASLIDDEGDLEVFLLMAAGSQNTDDYLAVLGLENSASNRMLVNSRRERIRGRIRRLRERLSDE